MIVTREEPRTLRIADDGSITLPATFVRESLAAHNRDDKGLGEDLEDFGPKRLVVVELADSDSGTEFVIKRDLRGGEVAR
jgi:hypothetical protein